MPYLDVFCCVKCRAKTVKASGVLVLRVENSTYSYLYISTCFAVSFNSNR